MDTESSSDTSTVISTGTSVDIPATDISPEKPTAGSFEIEGENEPYLGPSWAVLMFVLYALKTIFPATPYSYFWWFQIYVVCIVLGVTIFTLIKRHKYFDTMHEKKTQKTKNKKKVVGRR